MVVPSLVVNERIAGSPLEEMDETIGEAGSRQQCRRQRASTLLCRIQRGRRAFTDWRLHLRSCECVASRTVSLTEIPERKSFQLSPEAAGRCAVSAYDFMGSA